MCMEQKQIVRVEHKQETDAAVHLVVLGALYTGKLAALSANHKLVCSYTAFPVKK